MEQNFKKVEAKFKFYKTWTDITEKTQKVTVDLLINYHNKTFCITPENQTAGKFIFFQGGANAAIMWITITKVIKEAAIFAQKELEF